MPALKIINAQLQTEDEIIQTTYGDAVSLDGASYLSLQSVVDVTASTKTFDSGAANVSDTQTVADAGVKEVSDVTCVAGLGALEVSTVTTGADIAGSLNSTYFTFSAMNTGGGSQTNYYVWMNINSAGVDPAVGGATGIVVAAATGATADTIAGVMRSQVTSIAGSKVTVSGATNQCIITDKFMGNATNIADGVAPTGFTLATTTPGVASNLNSKYFNYETKNAGGASVNLRYVWYNVNGEGVDPSPASRTGVSVAITLGAQADTDVASGTRTALGADNKIVVTGGTNHAIITNVNMGNVTNADNGAASPGFSFSITPGVASNLNNSYFTFSETANAVNYYAWMNINSEGTDPVIVGKTAIAVTGVASVTANNLATSARAAIDSAIGPAIVVSGATNHIILTNSTRGTCTATANGAVSPGFTISNSPVGANTEVNISPDDSVDVPSHGLTTGFKGQLTTTGTLPAGLSLLTDYYVIVEDADTIQFASSLENALAGTAVAITDTGADNSVNTFTSSFLLNANIQIQISNDLNNPTNWTDYGDPLDVVSDGVIYEERINPPGCFVRLVMNLEQGRYSTSNQIIVKGLN